MPIGVLQQPLIYKVLLEPKPALGWNDWVCITHMQSGWCLYSKHWYSVQYKLVQIHFESSKYCNEKKKKVIPITELYGVSHDLSPILDISSRPVVFEVRCCTHTRPVPWNFHSASFLLHACFTYFIPVWLHISISSTQGLFFFSRRKKWTCTTKGYGILKCQEFNVSSRSPQPQKQ